MYQPRIRIGLYSIFAFALSFACGIARSVVHKVFSVCWYTPPAVAQPEPSAAQAAAAFVRAKHFMQRLMQRPRGEREPLWRMSAAH